MENVCVNTIAAPAEFLIIQRDRPGKDPSAVPTQRTESSYDSTKQRRQAGGPGPGQNHGSELSSIRAKFGFLCFLLSLESQSKQLSGWLGGWTDGLGVGGIQVREEEVEEETTPPLGCSYKLGRGLGEELLLGLLLRYISGQADYSARTTPKSLTQSQSY